MDLRLRKTGLTLVELLTVLVIIGLLVGILIPAIKAVRDTAKRAKQRAQFTSIEMAILSYKTDFGDYPPSGPSYNPLTYCGAEKLTEALVGWDLFGFHPDTMWLSTGELNQPGPSKVYYDPNVLDKRKAPYLDVSSSNAFELGRLYNNNPGMSTYKFGPNNYVLCDAFTRHRIPIGNEVFKVGTPILYYKADISKQGMSPSTVGNNRYEFWDNQELAYLVNGNQTTFTDNVFYGISRDYKILDQRILKSTGKSWPHNADSYILISAGIDGLYGTEDDMTNF
jgi:prepilin-type N-terminal cleavage/methylation domain-containing protein